MNAPVKKRIHVISRRKSGWAVKRSDRTKAGRLFNNLDDAVDYAKKYLSKGWYVVVHKEDGNVDYFIQPEKWRTK